MVATLASTASPPTTDVQRFAMVGLLVAACIGSSAFFACVTPFAALATLAALSSDRQTALLTVVLAWLGNQAIGYGVLGYPVGWSSFAWGAMIGVSACLATLTAHSLSTVKPERLAVSLPFVAAFVTYELGLYAASFVLPGGSGAFSASIIRYVFLVNLGSLIALKLGYALFALTVDAVRSHPPAPQSVTQIS